MEEDIHAIRLMLEALFDPSGLQWGLAAGITVVGAWFIFHFAKDVFDEKD